MARRIVSAMLMVAVAGCSSGGADDTDPPDDPGPAPVDHVGEFAVAHVIFSPDAGATTYDGAGFALSDGSNRLLVLGPLVEGACDPERIFDYQYTTPSSGTLTVRQPCLSRLWQGPATADAIANTEFSINAFTASRIGAGPGQLDATGSADPGTYDAARSEYPLTLSLLAGTYAPSSMAAAQTETGSSFSVSVTSDGAFTIHQTHCLPRQGSVTIPDVAGKGVAVVSDVPAGTSDGTGTCLQGNGQPFSGLLSTDGAVMRVILVQNASVRFYAGELTKN